MNLLLLLLERCGVDPAVAGDVVEEYRSGRSRGWFLWQAFAAAAIAIGRGIRQHKVLALRAIVVGLLAVRGVNGFVYLPVRETIDATLTAHGFSGPRLWFLFEPYVVAPMLSLACGMIAGWITGRLHRPYSVPLVAGLGVIEVLVTTPALYWLAVNAMTNTRFLPYLSLKLTDSGLVVVGLLLGAVLSAGREAAPTSSLPAVAD